MADIILFILLGLLVIGSWALSIPELKKLKKRKNKLDKIERALKILAEKDGKYAEALRKAGLL